MSVQEVIQAEWVAPMDSAVVRDGAVAFADGKILAVGPAKQVLATHPNARVTDLGQSIVLPGLVNAHTHLELSNCAAGESPGGSFTDWIVGIRARMKQPADGTHFAAAGAIEGMTQSLAYGVTTVGDISQNPAITRPIMRNGPLRVVSYGEVLGLAGAQHLAETRLLGAVDRSNDSATLRAAISPHAPYTVDLPTYQRCVQIAIKQQLPLATHLAENSDEREFLLHQTGPFRGVWDALKMWADGVQTHPAGPIEFAHAIGLLAYERSLLAHVNYCSDEELAWLAAGSASVVYCPRTHAYFGHPPHRWHDMLTAGINVAVGTDSCASSPDLNLVDELRLLRKIAPDVPAMSLWQLATTRAARAIGQAEQIGSLSPGKCADWIAFSTPSGEDNPLEYLLHHPLSPSQVCVNGINVLR